MSKGLRRQAVHQRRVIHLLRMKHDGGWGSVFDDMEGLPATTVDRVQKTVVCLHWLDRVACCSRKAPLRSPSR